MTLTFNSTKYKDLLVQYEPKIIRTEEENQRALAIVEELMHRQGRSIEEEELYELLIFLIEKFEQEYYQPAAALSPQSMLTFLMEQQGIKPADLIEVIGTQEMTSQVLEGKTQISHTLATALGEFFQVDCSVFIES